MSCLSAEFRFSAQAALVGLPVTREEPFMKLHPLACAALMAALLPVTAVRADVLVENLLQTQRGTSDIDSSLWAAQSFVTAAEAVNLQSIELWLGQRVGDPLITAELRADSASGPAATLATFGLPLLGVGAPQIELLPAVPQLQLAAGTTYWIVLGVPGAGSFGWTYAEGNNQAGPGTLGNFSYSTDGGGNWVNFGADNPYLVRVNVSAVPEPATAATMFVGMALLLALRRRRRA